jgi:hypothetical protein
MRKKILFIVGSPNQTTQMHQIAGCLTEYDCWFSQFFAESKLVDWVVKNGKADFSILGGQFREKSERYLRENNLQIDYKAVKNEYDLILLCTDMIVPKSLRNTKTIWVQEGMIDTYTLLSKIVKTLRLPSYFSIGTSLNGTSNIADIYCCASKGYKNILAKRGTERKKLIVTGIPNFDNAKQFLQNNFPYKNYVMVATSDIRECMRNDNRIAFIHKCMRIANGRPLIFKLHPNEIYERASKEISENTPSNTLIFQDGNTNEMIANCDELITQYSSVVYVGIALGKKVHSYFKMDELQQNAPIQNEGTSAQNIANICKNYLEFKGEKQHFLKNFTYKAIEPNYALFE